MKIEPTQFIHMLLVITKKCMICGHTTHDSDTVNHIKTEYEESLDDWLLFLDVTIDIFFQNCSSVDS